MLFFIIIIYVIIIFKMKLINLNQLHDNNDDIEYQLTDSREYKYLINSYFTNRLINNSYSESNQRNLEKALLLLSNYMDDTNLKINEIIDSISNINERLLNIENSLSEIKLQLKNINT